MKKRLQEKILEEIRNKVIERDLERNKEEEIKDMREANIEALTELTSLSRKEVEKIADEVKQDFLLKRQKNRKQMIYAGIGIIIIAWLGWTFFGPEPTLKARTVVDDFSDNSFEWSMYNTYNYKRYFMDGQYILDNNKDEWCYWDHINIELPENYDFESRSQWLSGKYDSYGIDLHYSNSDYYAFVLRGDGAVSFGKVVDKKWIIDDSWKTDKANAGGGQSNIQKVEVRGNQFNYYVNNELMRTGTIDMKINNIALRACGEQKVAYDYVKVTNADNNNVIFEDDFSNPSDLWEPKNDVLSESKIENGAYIFTCDNEDNCYWASSTAHKVTSNCEITLTSTWKSGESATYGLMVVEDDDNYFSCELKNDGNARLVESKNDEYVYVQNYVMTNAASTGKESVNQKVTIKNGQISYFVNDKLIKQKPVDLYLSGVALRLCGNQSVAFNKLSMTYYEK